MSSKWRAVVVALVGAWAAFVIIIGINGAQIATLHNDISAVMDTQDDDGVEVRDRIMELQDQIDSLRGDMDAVAGVVRSMEGRKEADDAR